MKINTPNKSFGFIKGTISKENKKLPLNPFDANFHANPYPAYHYVRQHDPVHKHFFGMWILTRYQDVINALRDPRFIADDISSEIARKSKFFKNEHEANNITEFSEYVSKWMFYLNARENKKVKSLLKQAFTPSAIEKYRVFIEHTADSLIRNIQPRGKTDIVKDIAVPLPNIVIAKFLGIPDQDRIMLHKWGSKLMHIADPVLSLEAYQELAVICKQFVTYLENIVEERLNNPQDDLITELANIQQKTQTITKQELIATLTVLFVAGEETTINLIPNAIAALIQNPKQLRLLKVNPGLIKQAVEEFIRYDSPLQYVARKAAENIQIDDKFIKKGDRVLLSLGAANRDPEEFNNPDQLDITREKNNHIGFSSGSHMCLGIFLARLEAQIVISKMVVSLPNIQLVSNKLVWQDHLALRRLVELPVKFNKTH